MSKVKSEPKKREVVGVSIVNHVVTFTLKPLGRDRLLGAKDALQEISKIAGGETGNEADQLIELLDAFMERLGHKEEPAADAK